jgi:hypothetical protein
MNDGTAVVRSDPTIRNITLNGNPAGMPMTCDTDYPSTPGYVATSNCDGSQVQPVLYPGTASATPNPTFCGVNKLYATGCTKPLVQTDNQWAVQLAAYKAVPDYLWQAVVQYGLATPAELGVYPERGKPVKRQ